MYKIWKRLGLLKTFDSDTVEKTCQKRRTQCYSER